MDDLEDHQCLELDIPIDRILTLDFLNPSLSILLLL